MNALDTLTVGSLAYITVREPTGHDATHIAIIREYRLFGIIPTKFAEFGDTLYRATVRAAAPTTKGTQ